MTQLRVPFLTVLFTLVSFFVLSKVFGPIPFTITSVTTTNTDIFTATGVGEAEGTPQSARISLGITKTAKTTAEAKDQVNKTINQITADIKRLGVQEKDIKTANFSTNPDYDYASGKNSITGYTVSQNLAVIFDTIDKANKAIDIATAAGANQIGGVNFTLDDTKKEELEQEARVKAIANAKEKAQKIAQAAGIRLGRVINIQESTDGQPIPMLYKASADTATTSEPTQLNPGENKIRIQVTLSYETL